MRRGAEETLVGIDLDNTLADYDGVFGEVGATLGMLPRAYRDRSKHEIKTYLTATEGGETAWMRLQGQVYGRYMGLARPYAGVAAFFAAAAQANARIAVVSHRTQYGHFDETRADLRTAARDWLEGNGFLDGRLGQKIAPADLHFEATRASKIARIREIGCAVFIDDLAEVLLDAEFPAATRAIWFRAEDRADEHALEGFGDWHSIAKAVCGRAPLQPSELRPNALEKR